MEFLVYKKALDIIAHEFEERKIEVQLSYNLSSHMITIWESSEPEYLCCIQGGEAILLEGKSGNPQVMTNNFDNECSLSNGEEEN